MKKEEIKGWLDRAGLDRAWLGSQLGVSKRTVDNWLSTSIEIPARKLAVIEEMMRRPAAAPDDETEMTLLLRLGEREFDAISHAALRDGEPIREWARRKVVEAAGE